jgi:hypothetical protein
MRTAAVFLIAAVALSPVAAKDLALKGDAKIEITTNTAYGFSLDDPDKRGLGVAFSHFAITYGITGGGLLTDAIKSDDPYGFIQMEFGGLEMDWGNLHSLYDKDLNQPSTTGNTSLGFNSGGTGYTYPIYIERLVSGINWGKWFLQLAAGGDPPENWRPWSNFERGYIKSEFLQRWAYPDTRLQYQRPNIPVMLKGENAWGIPNENQYWNNGNPYDSNSTLATGGTLRDLVLNPQGTLVGLSYTDDDFSAQLKFVTETDWNGYVTSNSLEPNPTAASTPKNGAPGQAFGLDTSFTPQELPALKAYASAGIEMDYGAPGTPQPWALGGKVGYNLAVTDQVSVEPYVGVQVKHWDKVGYVGTLQYLNANEGSVGLTIHWPGDGGWQWDPLQQRNGVLFPGLTLAYTIRDNNDLYSTASTSLIQKGSNPIQSILVTLYEESGDAGLLEGWGAEGAVQYNDFQNFSRGLGAAHSMAQLLTSLYVDYTIPDVANGDLVPWTKLYFDHLTLPAGTVLNNTKVDVGLRLEKAIRNATIELRYESLNLTGTTRATNNLDSGFQGLGLIRLGVEVRI